MIKQFLDQCNDLYQSPYTLFENDSQMKYFDEKDDYLKETHFLSLNAFENHV